MALEVKVRSTVEHCGWWAGHFPKTDKKQVHRVSWNAKEVEFLRSYLRLLFSCWPRFAASSQAEDNWRNTFRSVKHTPSENVCLPPTAHTPPPNLLSTSHAGQKKDPGEHCNKEEADRGGEAEAPVHKGACWLWSQGPATGSKVSGSGCVAVIMAPTTKKEMVNCPHHTQRVLGLLWGLFCCPGANNTAVISA